MRVILGLYRDNGKENGNHYLVYWGHIGILGNKIVLQGIWDNLSRN